MKTILSLFDYSGNWPRPYQENGYRVVQIDIKHDIDIMTWMYKSDAEFLGFADNVYGILIAVPCTCFAGSGARWWKEMDKSGRTEQNIALVRKSLEIVEYFKPKFWALENPVGRIQKLVPEIGERRIIFNPCDYGGYGDENDAYTKKTCLWGNFNIPEKKPIEPVYHYSKGKRSSWIWKNLGGKSEKTKELRSKTPMGFARAFFEANR